MNNLIDEPPGSTPDLHPADGLLPAAVAMTVLCVVFFALLFIV